MKIIFLVVFAVALVHGENGEFSSDEEDTDDLVNIYPCEERSSSYQYNQFVRKHVLQESFDRKDPAEWADYLMSKNLCGRVPTQTFIDRSASHLNHICSGSGRRVKDAFGSIGNWCMSTGAMPIYDVQSQLTHHSCDVTVIKPSKEKVVLSCNKVNNNCLPVHYEPHAEREPTEHVCS